METMQQDESLKDERAADSVENAEHQGAKKSDSDNNNDDLKEALADAEAQAAEFKDKFLRAAAEMENMRRRMEKERSDLLQYGLDKIMGDLLPILDAFDKAHSDASAQEQDKPNPLYEGLQLLHKQLVTTLEKHGLKEVDPKDEAFDPNLHQAIQKVDRDDVEIDTVQDVYQKGYTLNSRLVRPAMVSVAVSVKKSENDN